jgi:hypothetical protein
MFALFMAIGPGDDEVARAADVLDSVRAYSTHLRWVVFVDDAPEPRDLAASCAVPAECCTAVLRNPRNGVGYGRTGGLCVADLVAFEYIQQHTRAEYVLKLDTDSLVIAPFERQVEHELASRPDAGLLGVLGDSFGENRSFRNATYNLTVIENAMTLPDSFEALTVADFSKPLMLPPGPLSAELYQDLLDARSMMARAMEQGYEGKPCQGGGYVVSRSLLDALAHNGAFARPLLWRRLPVCEDHMMSMQCIAAGLKIYDVSQTGPRFAISPLCIPLFLKDLASSDYSIVHSIRGTMEDRIREFFRERRSTSLTPYPGD